MGAWGSPKLLQNFQHTRTAEKCFLPATWVRLEDSSPVQPPDENTAHTIPWLQPCETINREPSWTPDPQRLWDNKLCVVLNHHICGNLLHHTRKLIQCCSCEAKRSICQAVMHMWAAWNSFVCKTHPFSIEHLLNMHWDYIQGLVKAVS